MNRSTDGRTNGWTDQQMDGRTDGWMNRHINTHLASPCELPVIVFIVIADVDIAALIIISNVVIEVAAEC